MSVPTSPGRVADLQKLGLPTPGVGRVQTAGLGLLLASVSGSAAAFPIDLDACGTPMACDLADTLALLAFGLAMVFHMFLIGAVSRWGRYAPTKPMLVRALVCAVLTMLALGDLADGARLLFYVGCVLWLPSLLIAALVSAVWTLATGVKRLARRGRRTTPAGPVAAAVGPVPASGTTPSSATPPEAMGTGLTEPGTPGAR